VTTRVLLADDHPVVLSGLKQILALEKDFEVVAAVTDGDAAVREIRARKPDVAVLDLRMPGLSGLDIIRQLSSEESQVKFVLLTASLTDNEVVEALRYGVSGIVLKELAPNVLMTCLRKVAAGGQWLEKDAVGKALTKMVRREQGLETIAGLLTARELEIVKLVCMGMRNKEIAEKLSVTEGTVKVHLHSVYEKTKVAGRLELMLYARDKGIA
jgi:DNA-binding NarL/FixJ family response regulator